MNRSAWLGAIALVLAASTLDAVVPPLGVPVALLCIWGVFRVRKMGWADLGMARPESWPRTLAAGVLGAAAIFAVMRFAVDPVVALVSPAPADLSRFDAMRGNVGMLVTFLVVSWTTAGFGEEMIWRGFLLPGLARVFGDGRLGWALALVVMTALFGGLHAYQGLAGMISTGCVGLMLAGLYLVTGRNLWPAILAHGLLDTVGFLALFFGWA